MPDADSSMGWAGESSLNALKHALELLGKTGLPGADLTTGALVAVLDNFKDMKQLRGGWDDLSKRINRLWALSLKAKESGIELNDIPQSLDDELKSLAADLETVVSKRHGFGRVKSFFTVAAELSTIDGHKEELDTIITEMTCAISLDTNDGVRQILSQANGRMSAPLSEREGITLEIVNSTVGGDAEKLNADNKGAAIHAAIEGLKVGGNARNINSGNVSGD